MNINREASEAIRRREEQGVNTLKNTASAAVAGAPILASGAIGRIIPLLSNLVPDNLSIKGLGKVDPRLGKVADKALENGYEASDVKEFIGNKIEQSQQPAQKNRNIIEQESTELHQFIDQEIKGGRKPIEAGAIAQNDKRFSSIIQKLMKAHKIPWSQIIESVYGAEETAQPANQQQSQQPGQGQQALMSILQKINQRRAK